MQDNPHIGHRQRMRRKLFEYSRRVFDTYELLEMLLYFSVKISDTNPISKELLRRFSSLDQVLSEDLDGLLQVQGVGEKTARLIRSVDLLHTALLKEDPQSKKVPTLNESYIHSLFIGEDGQSIFMIALDGDGSILSSRKLYSLDYSSGGVRADAFVKAAEESGASSVIIAHNHPRGPLFPTPGDIETNKLIAYELCTHGIVLLEHFLVSGDSVAATMGNGITAKPDESVSGVLVALSSLLSLLSADGTVIDRLTKEFSEPRYIFEADADTLTSMIGEKWACLIILVSALLSRRVTDKYSKAKRLTREATENYLNGIFFGLPYENVYLLSFAANGELIACDFVSEGTVNASEIIPKKLLSIAKKRGASSVIVAHNHPFSTATPSEDDISATALLEAMLLENGLRLDAHYAVAQNQTIKIPKKY